MYFQEEFEHKQMFIPRRRCEELILSWLTVQEQFFEVKPNNKAGQKQFFRGFLQSSLQDVIILMRTISLSFI